VKQGSRTRNTVTPPRRSSRIAKCRGLNVLRGLGQAAAAAKQPVTSEAALKSFFDDLRQKQDMGIRRLPGETGHKYRLGMQIGRGANAKVSECMNEETGERFAVKQIQLRDSDDDEEVGRLVSEIGVLSSLKHRNIMGYIETMRENSGISIVTEYLEGGSILHTLRAFGKFTEPSTARLTCQILRGLQFVHHANIVHRDIKAANIMLTKAGVCKIGDFGAAKALSAGHGTEMREIVGTPHWMAPEMIIQQRYDHKVDVWSLGCTVVEMLTGSPPNKDLNTYAAMYFCADSEGKHGGADFENAYIPALASEEAKAFLRRCFVKDPAQRPSAQELVYDPWIEEAMANSPEASYKEVLKAAREQAADGEMKMGDENIARMEGHTDCPVLKRPMFDAVLFNCGHSMSDEACKSMGRQIVCPCCQAVPTEVVADQTTRGLCKTFATELSAQHVKSSGSAGDMDNVDSEVFSDSSIGMSAMSLGSAAALARGAAEPARYATAVDASSSGGY